MKSMKQFFVLFFIVQFFQFVLLKPIFKGLSLKKNYEMEISAIPFKHISFIKEKWLPFKLIGVTHDIAKREVVEDPKDENMYSVNEVSLDDEANGNVPGLFTSVNHLGLNSDEKIMPVPVVENIQAVHIKPILELENLAAGIVHTSSVIPINPSLIIAPSIHTMGTAVQSSAVVPTDPDIVSSALKETEVQPIAPQDEITPIQPVHTHIDIPSVEKLEESVSKMHTNISSAVPLNGLIPSLQETELPLPVNIKVETPIIETPKVTEEVKVQPIVEPPPVVTPVVDPSVIEPVVKLPALVPGLEVEVPGKTGPSGLIMRGTRFVLYFGSVMLQLLSKMISHNPINLNQLTEPLVLK